MISSLFIIGSFIYHKTQAEMCYKWIKLIHQQDLRTAGYRVGRDLQHLQPPSLPLHHHPEHEPALGLLGARGLSLQGNAPELVDSPFHVHASFLQDSHAITTGGRKPINNIKLTARKKPAHCFE